MARRGSAAFQAEVSGTASLLVCCAGRCEPMLWVRGVSILPGFDDRRAAGIVAAEERGRTSMARWNDEDGQPPLGCIQFGLPLQTQASALRHFDIQLSVCEFYFKKSKCILHDCSNSVPLAQLDMRIKQGQNSKSSRRSVPFVWACCSLRSSAQRGPSSASRCQHRRHQHGPAGYCSSFVFVRP